MNPLSVSSALTQQPAWQAMGQNNPLLKDLPKARLIPPAELASLQTAPAPYAKQAEAVEGGSFQKLLTDFVSDVNRKGLEAGEAVRDFYSGKDVSLHEAVVGVQEASVSFQMMVEVRNKLLEGYQELIRMQM